MMLVDLRLGGHFDHQAKIVAGIAISHRSRSRLGTVSPYSASSYKVCRSVVCVVDTGCFYLKHSGQLLATKVLDISELGPRYIQRVCAILWHGDYVAISSDRVCVSFCRDCTYTLSACTSSTRSYFLSAWFFYHTENIHSKKGGQHRRGAFMKPAPFRFII